MGECIMAPVKPFRLPRPTGPLVHPVLYETIYSLRAVDNDTPLKAVVKINMDIKKHIQVFTSGVSVPLTNAEIGTWDTRYGVPALSFDHPKTIEYGDAQQYSFPLRISDSSGLIIQPILAEAGDGFEDVLAYIPATQEFKRGFVWFVNTNINNAIHEVVCEGIQIASPQVVNPGGSTLRIQGVVKEGPRVMPSGAYVDKNYAEADATESYIVSTAAGAFTLLYRAYSKDQVLNQLEIKIKTVTSTYTGQAELDIAVSYSKAFDTFLETSRKISLSAMHAMATFSGGMSKAGNIACCLAPYGEPMSLDPNVLIDQIAKFPETRKFIGVPAEGLHTTWVPDGIDQWYLQDTKGLSERTFNWTDTHKTQSIYFAIDCPASGTLQPTSFQIKSWMNIEGENYDPVYSASSCNNASLLLNAVVDTLGTIQVCSGNPNHVQKVLAGCRKIASNPTVRMMGKAALTLGKVLGPAVISML